MTTAAESLTLQSLTANSKSVKNNPWLFSINGIGFMFSGVALRHPHLGADRFVRMHWFAIFYLPIVPLGIYLVSHPIDTIGRRQSEAYVIHRAVSVKGVASIWGMGGFLRMFVSGWFIVIGVFVALVILVTIVAAISLWQSGSLSL